MSLSLYIHWPFCTSKCPYCDFNSYVSSFVDEERWLRAMQLELQRNFPEYVSVQSVFFGGGTPSLMSADLVYGILEAVRSVVCVKDAEITLESNPSSTEAQKMHKFLEAGINRLSLGVQSFSDENLKFLGRKHSALEARIALEKVKEVFHRVNVDLIYALPGQEAQAWLEDLNILFSYEVEHLSLYQLVIEKKTPFYVRHQSGEFVLPSSSFAVDLWDLTEDRIKERGYTHYEVSAYARSGGMCVHNVAVWHYQDYVGIGPGAHGRVTREGQKYATEAYKRPIDWLEAVESRGSGERFRTMLSAEDRFYEWLSLGLRLTEGLNLLDSEAHFLNSKRVRILEEEGLIIHNKDLKTLCSTYSGMLVLDSIVQFLSITSEY